jgi:hypothetical protein
MNAERGVLTDDDLKKLTGYTRSADIEKWARSVGLRVFRSRGRVWTTVAAANHALGITPDAEREKVEF